MASVDSTPVRELSDAELRKRLLAKGIDVPVSVNREFLMRQLEKSSTPGGGGKGKQRHSMAATPSSVTNSPSTARKRKSLAVNMTSTPTTPSNHSSGSSTGTGSSRRDHHHQQQHHHQNNINSPPVSPLASTPQQHYGGGGSNNSSMSIQTPSTPSPFVSRLSLSTPSPSSSPVNNGEPPSPRYMSYYNMFKTTPTSAGGNDGLGGYGGGYGYNRSIRMSAPGTMGPVTSVPQTRAERNGYATGSGGAVESEWLGGHLVSKILVAGFIIFFLIIGLLYFKQSMTVQPRGLPGAASSSSASSESVKPVKEAPPQPPPPKKEAKPPQLPPLSMIFPICGTKGTDPEACIPKEVVKNSRTLFNAMKGELILRARKQGCAHDARDTISLQEARTLLYTLTDLRKADVDAAFQGMLLLVTENPREQLVLSKEGTNEISSKDVVSGLDMSLTMIAADGVNPDFFCWIKDTITKLTTTVLILAACSGAGVVSWKFYGVHKERKRSEEQELFRFVEEVLDLLKAQFDLSEQGQGPAYLAVNHVRDELLPPQERLKKEALWNKVVHHISNNESRVREEIQHISGEEFKVWRWLPSASPLVSKSTRFSTANSYLSNKNKLNRQSMPASPAASSFGPGPLSSTPNMGIPAQTLQKSLYPNLNALNGDVDEDDMNNGSDPNSNDKWQGQAFETCEGSPNALPSSPTTCLKIRHMFTDAASDKSRIHEQILKKCKDARILHIGIDQASVEGCVYIRCLTKDDARKAFMALHGWWYDGHLLSVKFLREERYFSRFPEAKSSTVPMSLAR